MAWKAVPWAEVYAYGQLPHCQLALFSNWPQQQPTASQLATLLYITVFLSVVVNENKLLK